MVNVGCRIPNEYLRTVSSTLNPRAKDGSNLYVVRWHGVADDLELLRPA